MPHRLQGPESPRSRCRFRRWRETPPPPAPPSGAQKANLTGTHFEWTGLENGVAYQVHIQAYNNAVEPSTWSEYSSNEIPAGPPEQVAKPTTSRLTPVGNRAQIAVVWQIPSGNGDPVSSFTVSARVGGSVAATQTVSGSTTTVPFELDPSSSDYTFSVVAKNKAGASVASPNSDPRRAFVAPGAPTGVATRRLSPMRQSGTRRKNLRKNRLQRR